MHIKDDKFYIREVSILVYVSYFNLMKYYFVINNNDNSDSQSYTKKTPNKSL